MLSTCFVGFMIYNVAVFMLCYIMLFSVFGLMCFLLLSSPCYLYVLFVFFLRVDVVCLCSCLRCFFLCDVLCCLFCCVYLCVFLVDSISRLYGLAVFCCYMLVFTFMCCHVSLLLF